MEIQKLIYVNPTRFPTERAHGIQVGHMCSAFSAQSIDVCMVSPKSRRAIKIEPFEYYNLDNRFKLKNVAGNFFPPRYKLGLIINVLIFAFSAYIYIRKSDVGSIIYSRDEYVLAVISLLAPRRKLVWESHEAKYNFAARFLFKKNIKVIVISEGIKKFYIDCGISVEKLCVAHDAIDDSFFAQTESREIMRKKLGISVSKPVVMYIGGLDIWKGVETLFEVSKLSNDFQVVVIGGRLEEVDRYSRRYPKIIFLGFKPYSELPNNQQVADVLVIPNTGKSSLAALYTSPLKLFAHMTSNIPIVASDVPSLKSVLKDTGIYFQADEPNSLLESLNYVINNRFAASEKAKAAFDMSLAYTWKFRAKKILNFIAS